MEDIEEPIQIPSIEEKSLRELDLYKNAIENLKKLIDLGKKYSIFIIQELTREIPNIEKIRGFGNRLDEIDSLSIKLKNNYPLMGTPIEYFYLSKAMATGNNLIEITQNIFFVLEEYSTFLEIILELINNIKSRFTIIERGN